MDDAEEITVLYCEDDGDYADVVVQHLARVDPDLSVVHADSAAAAREALDPAVHDCVLSDYDLPGTDGIELLESFRADHPDLPFVLYTQRGSEEVASRAIGAGVTDYVRKGSRRPQFELLANRITAAVRHHRAERARERLATRYELVEEASPDAFWDRDMRTDTVELGAGFEGLLGYEPGVREDSFEWWYDKVHPDDRERVVAEIEDAIERAENFYEGDLRFRRADGTYAAIAGRGHIVYDDGVPVREVGVVVDRDWR